MKAHSALLLDTRGTLVYSDDPRQLIATLGCQDMIVVHTDRATLICPKNRAQDVKNLYAQVVEKFGREYV